MNYKKSSDKHSLDEIADAHIISADISAIEKQEVIDAFREERKKMFLASTNEQRILSSILQLRFQMEDYLKTAGDAMESAFCFFLKEYISRLRLRNKDFAEQLGIEATELSQLLNAHRKPNDKILIRLEIHSNQNIDAVLWFKILEKDKENELTHNAQLRQNERKYVKQFASL